jgi:hypothetical protein
VERGFTVVKPVSRNVERGFTVVKLVSRNGDNRQQYDMIVEAVMAKALVIICK